MSTPDPIDRLIDSVIANSDPVQREKRKMAALIVCEPLMQRRTLLQDSLSQQESKLMDLVKARKITPQEMVRRMDQDRELLRTFDNTLKSILSGS